MNSVRKHLCLLVAVALAAPAAMAGESPAATNAAGSVKTDDLFPDVVVAKGKGFEIKRSKLDAALINAKMVASYADGHAGKFGREKFVGYYYNSGAGTNDASTL